MERRGRHERWKKCTTRTISKIKLLFCLLRPAVDCARRFRELPFEEKADLQGFHGTVQGGSHKAGGEVD
jgi:hypothetical protein